MANTKNSTPGEDKEGAALGSKASINKSETQGTSKKDTSAKEQDKSAAKKKKPRAQDSAPKKPILSMAVQFLREVKIELKKVTWPSRKEAVGSTLVVLIVVFIMSIFLGFVDFGLSHMVGFVIK